MPMRKNEKNVVFGPWKAEYWAWVKSEVIDGEFVETYRWRNYNRPHHHIHNGVKYDFAYLAKNLKAANEDPPGGSSWRRKILRMRNVKTGDFIPADIL